MTTFRILMSFHYFRRDNLDELFPKLFGDGPMPEVFADSGAFSAMTQGTPVDLAEYAAWIERWRHLFAVYANLDVIGNGDEGAEATWRNQRTLEDDYGLRPLPVFHTGESWDHLDRLLDAGHSYIALGGLVGKRSKAIIPWAVHAMQRAQDRAVFHGFGMTSWEPLAALPWYSVDSSRWGMGYRFGTLILFDEERGKLRIVKNTHAGVYDGASARLIREYGFDPAAFAVRDSKNRERMAQIGAASFARIEAWLRERHGVVRIPEGDHPEGVRVYLADSDTRVFHWAHRHPAPPTEGDHPMTTAVAVVSGGMDSVTLAHLLRAEGHDLILVSVDYGQRHVKELTFAAECAERLDAEHHVVDLTSVTKLLVGSALTDPTVDVPLGHYAAPTMVATIVPNRNATILSIATSIAVARGAQLVATGVHAGDHAVYPDCRPSFIEAFDRMVEVANEGVLPEDWQGITAPFVWEDKTEIARRGEALGVPWARTWSCYRGGEFHCGECGTCVERQEALTLAGIVDPTEYGF